jgi:hypothetical protein
VPVILARRWCVTRSVTRVALRFQAGPSGALEAAAPRGAGVLRCCSGARRAVAGDAHGRAPLSQAPGKKTANTGVVLANEGNLNSGSEGQFYKSWNWNLASI